MPSMIWSASLALVCIALAAVGSGAAFAWHEAVVMGMEYETMVGVGELIFGVVLGCGLAAVWRR